MLTQNSLHNDKKILASLLLLILFLLPINLLIPKIGVNEKFIKKESPKTSQSPNNTLNFGIVAAGATDWDPATSEVDLMSYIKDSALESLVWQDTKGDIHPLLAESWTIHKRPNGTSTAGPNQGGVAAFEFKLRENVTFHDGSAFNASVVKWNYDRALQISGYDDLQWNANYWMNPASYRTRFTTNWDLTWAINDPEVSFIDTANWATIPDGGYINYTAKTSTGVNNYYIWFDKTGGGSADPAPTGRTPIYCDISAAATQENVSNALGAALGAITEITATNTLTNVTITNVYGGDVTDIADVDSGLTVSTVSDGVMRNPFKTVNPEYIPKINSTDVISEYIVNVTMNTWYTDISAFSGRPSWQISQEAYGSWHNKSIEGYESVPNAPDGTPFPGHMIGTGPYKFESVDFVVEAKAHSTKNMNYWNRTALEALGVFSVTDLYVRFFADQTALGNALLATDIDLMHSMLQAPAPIADVEASPYLDYIPIIPDASPNVISILSAEAINTPLASLGGQTIREWFPTSDFCTDTLGLPSGTPYPDGVNKTVRKALSWAYDYNGFISANYPATGGGGIYCWSPFGMNSPFTDESGVTHPGPDPDLTTARTILLSDPYYAGQCAARGLTLANSTAEWNAIAAIDPIDSYTFLTYPGAMMTGFLTEACEALGFEVDVKEDAAVAAELWIKFVVTGRACMYDMFPYIYLMNPKDPAQWGNYWYASSAAKPPGWGFNYAHLMNATVDNILTNTEFLEDKFDAYNELADILINKEVPAIYESQGNMGICINTGFNYTAAALEFGGPTLLRISIAHIGGERALFVIFDLISPLNTTYTALQNGGLPLEYYSDKSLAWTGYSLDGGANVTFSGNTTIPMPSNGPHSIQVYGNDSLGIMYQTEVRYFIVDLPKSLSLFNPDSSSIWEPGSAQYINWTFMGSISNIKIELYLDAAFVMEMISSTPNTGNFYFIVDPTLTESSNYQIKIIDMSDSSVFAYSDYFEISTPTPIPEIPGYNIFILIGLIGILGFYLRKKKFHHE